MQSYQEVTLEIIEELPILGKQDPQEYFWYLQQEQPERFRRLDFDINGFDSYCDDLSSIMFDLVLAGLYARPSRYEKRKINADTED